MASAAWPALRQGPLQCLRRGGSVARSSLDLRVRSFAASSTVRLAGSSRLFEQQKPTPGSTEPSKVESLFPTADVEKKPLVIDVKEPSGNSDGEASQNAKKSKRRIRPPGKKRKRRRKRLTILAILGLALLAGYELDVHVNESILQRNLRTAWAGAAIALDYKLKFDAKNPEAIEALHERCAARLLHVCEKNGGLYIKLGQAIGVQAAVLPKPYHALAKMFDDAERMDFRIVRKVVEKELGKPLQEVFSSFDEMPIAAASVAQVHKATVKETGETVAVKVQRPAIRAQAFWDLLSFRVLLRFYSHWFDLPLSYFGGYISEQIHRETDFLAELHNATKAREDVQKDPVKVVRETCYVPYCLRDLSSRRVLTMEFITGATRMTDEQGIIKMGLSVKEVARSVCEVFASQIFQHGFIQCDGHAGNVLVRRHPNGKDGKHQVVLIDHGLYVSLSETFRRQYAELWKAIFEVDTKTLGRITKGWGMKEESAELFASATLMRPWRKPKSKKEQEHDRQEREKQGGRYDYNKQKQMIKDFLVNVELVPKELIFVGRSMRIVQANNQVLHSPVNRINIIARHAASALLSSDTPTLRTVLRPYAGTSLAQKNISERLGFWLSTRFAYVKFRTTLLLLDVVFVGSAVYRAVGWTYNLTGSVLLHGPFSEHTRATWRAQSGGFEDDLEEGMRQLAKDELGVELDKDAFMG